MNGVCSPEAVAARKGRVDDARRQVDDRGEQQPPASRTGLRPDCAHALAARRSARLSRWSQGSPWPSRTLSLVPIDAPGRRRGGMRGRAGRRPGDARVESCVTAQGPRQPQGRGAHAVHVGGVRARTNDANCLALGARLRANELAHGASRDRSVARDPPGLFVLALCEELARRLYTWKDTVRTNHGPTLRRNSRRSRPARAGDPGEDDLPRAPQQRLRGARRHRARRRAPGSGDQRSPAARRHCTRRRVARRGPAGTAAPERPSCTAVDTLAALLRQSPGRRGSRRRVVE